VAEGAPPEVRRSTGIPGLDRVLGGGLMAASVVLVAGEPGIGKSTLLLHAVAGLTAGGVTCLIASGEESRGQVAARAARLGVDASALRYVSGRDAETVLAAARAERPGLLVVDSIQTLRLPDVAGLAGGVSQVRACTDALVGLAKEDGCAVLVVGHVTKDGDLAGPRTLEHAVDAVLTFSGDSRSGLRMLAAGKNRFGEEGEAAWFEMTSAGLREIDPAGHLMASRGEPGAAVALCLAGRRGVAVEIQGLFVGSEGPARRYASGLDARRFAVVAAVLERAGYPIGRGELYGAVAGGVRVDDPGADLAVAAALASSWSATAPPEGAAFVGEVSLTGTVRGGPGTPIRLAAARAAGLGVVYAPEGTREIPGVQVRPVRHLRDALGWAGRPARSVSAENGL
jgi:DNA repair protein RadA/Sms